MPIEPVQLDMFGSFQVDSPPKERVSQSHYRETLKKLLSENLDFHGEDSSYAIHRFRPAPVGDFSKGG